MAVSSENGLVKWEWQCQVRRAGSGDNGWVRLAWQYKVRMARSRSGRKANVKLAWQYEMRMARSNGKGRE